MYLIRLNFIEVIEFEEWRQILRSFLDDPIDDQRDAIGIELDQTGQHQLEPGQ